MLQFLLEHQADVNRSDWSGRTPLIIAAARNDFLAVQILLDAGAEPEARNADGRTPLLAAVKEDAIASAETLLKFGANADGADGDGNTPLLKAVGKGYPEGLALTRLLIAHGADLKARNKGGVTALIAAAAFVYREPWGEASKDIFQELLSRGADANASSVHGTTPLIAASAAAGHDDPLLLELLLNASADVNATDADGKTALMAASERGHVQKVEFLLSHGAKADVKDKKGRTALDYAADFKYSRSSDYRPGCISSDWGNCAKTRDVLRRSIRDGKTRHSLRLGSGSPAVRTPVVASLHRLSGNGLHASHVFRAQACHSSDGSLDPAVHARRTHVRSGGCL